MPWNRERTPRGPPAPPWKCRHRLAATDLWLDLYASRADELDWIGSVALIAWGTDEIVRGSNPARRLLGLVVLGRQVYRPIS